MMRTPFQICSYLDLTQQKTSDYLYNFPFWVKRPLLGSTFLRAVGVPQLHMEVLQLHRQSHLQELRLEGTTVTEGRGWVEGAKEAERGFEEKNTYTPEI